MPPRQALEREWAAWRIYTDGRQDEDHDAFVRWKKEMIKEHPGEWATITKNANKENQVRSSGENKAQIKGGPLKESSN
jgi:hypothetical protein